MPYKSDAQRRFFHAAEARGDMSKSTVDEFDQASKGKKLPEHVKKLYEGGMIDADEYEDFQSRYQLSSGEEHKSNQEFPNMSEEPEYKTPHSESPLPSQGYDREMTEEPGDEHNLSGGDDSDILSREEYAEALKRRKYKR